MIAVFDSPLTAGHIEQRLAIGLFSDQRRQAGDSQHRFVGFLSAFQIAEVSMDAHDLLRRAEPHLFRGDGQGPEFTSFQSTVAFLHTAGLCRIPRKKKRCPTDVRLWPGRMVDCP